MRQAVPTAVSGRFSLTSDEAAALARDGFLLREDVYTPDELARLAADCEALVAEVTAASHGQKHVLGHYMFEIQRELELYAKWEPDFPEVLQGIEPFSHMSPALRDWGLDPRLTEPCATIVGQDDLVLFTEKLNLKRARQGGSYILHQDFPYWRESNPAAARVGTAMIFLDDATVENGCLEVAPGTHLEGVQAMKAVEGFGANEMDPDRFDHGRLRPLEAKAGSVVFFGAFLVHRSLPNRSAQDRRALLYSYHPAGYPHEVELARALLQERKRRKAAQAAST